jgi:hypothetical protein
MTKKLLLLVFGLALVAAACGASDPFADLEPVRAIEQLDNEGPP